MKIQFYKSCIILLIVICSAATAKDVYKYQDNNGKWVFSDKKPLTTQKINKLQYKTKKKKISRPIAYIQKIKKDYVIKVKNPLYAPIEIEYKSSLSENTLQKLIIPAATTVTLVKSKNNIKDFSYRWILGKPGSEEDGYVYRIPIASKQSYKITQSFRGRFSHSKRPSIHAVDIAMRFGTEISAAREGTVIWVKDDYHLGGKKAYFRDKANFIKILHKDGTYAVYAHILQGTSTVKAGEKVEVGDKLALSGSSGFSTGPHLHFVIQKNVGMKTESVPFKFFGDNGHSFTPRKGLHVAGFLGTSDSTTMD